MIIDSDAHVIETEHTWDFMDESEQAFRPRAAVPRDPPRAGARGVPEYWVIDGRLLPRRQNVGLDTPLESREMDDITARIRHMDQLEVDVQVLYPTLFLRPITTRPEVELALARSYNRWMADIWKRGGGRLRWACLLPWYSVSQAVDELRFAKANGACAIFARYAEADQLLNAPAFYPIYEEANDLDVPVCVHASSGTMETHELFTNGSSVPLFKLGPIGAFATVVSSKLPELFPRLRWGFIEVRAQWIPYMCHHFYHTANKQATWWKDGLLRERRVYVAIQTDDDIPYVLQYAGEDNLIIGTDYGHDDSSSELDALRILRANGEVNPRAIDKMLDDNARALYGL